MKNDIYRIDGRERVSWGVDRSSDSRSSGRTRVLLHSHSTIVAFAILLCAPSLVCGAGLGAVTMGIGGSCPNPGSAVNVSWEFQCNGNCCPTNNNANLNTQVDVWEDDDLSADDHCWGQKIIKKYTYGGAY